MVVHPSSSSNTRVVIISNLRHSNTTATDPRRVVRRLQVPLMDIVNSPLHNSTTLATTRALLNNNMALITRSQASMADPECPR